MYSNYLCFWWRREPLEPTTETVRLERAKLTLAPELGRWKQRRNSKEKSLLIDYQKQLCNATTSMLLFRRTALEDTDSSHGNPGQCLTHVSMCPALSTSPHFTRTQTLEYAERQCSPSNENKRYRIIVRVMVR